MRLKLLDSKEISKLYQEHMIIDFPKDELKPLNMILKAVEDEVQKSLQTRRLNFYLRNSCKDTGLRINCFGVKYIILEAGKTHFKDKGEVWNLYERFYKSFLPEDKFNKNIRRLN